MSGVHAPLEEHSAVEAFQQKLRHFGAEEAVCFSFEKLQLCVRVGWLGSACVEENCLLVPFTPRVTPLVGNSIHLHPSDGLKVFIQVLLFIGLLYCLFHSTTSHLFCECAFYSHHIYLLMFFL